MADYIDSKMSQEHQEQVKKVLKELGVDGLRIRFDSKQAAFVFERDRRVVSVPVKLIENDQWADIRFLFRAILESPNSLWNRAADGNEWSGTEYYGLD